MTHSTSGVINIKLALSSLTLVLSFSLLSGCASTPASKVTESNQTIIAPENKPVEPSEAELSETDPYENFNRNIYAFNSSVDTYIANPVTKAYKFVTPNLLQTGVANFFTNLGNVSVVLNDVLQGKAQQSMEDTGRFLINSTVGVFGLFDVASEIGLPQNQEDFGQTLAVWGVPTGPYVVFPFLGPTTFRGMPGAAVDIATNPITYLGIPAIQVASVVNSRASADGALQFIDEAALDPYIFTREAYLQWRNHLVTDGRPDADEDPFADFEDELFEDDLFENEQLYEVKIDMPPENNQQTNANATPESINTETTTPTFILLPPDKINTTNIDPE